MTYKISDVVNFSGSGGTPSRKNKEYYEKGTNQNRLRDEDIDRIVEAYERREEVDKFAYVATLDEVKENDYNLNIPRYVDTFEEEEPVDMEKVKENIANIEEELAGVKAQMDEYLEELGL